MDRYYLYPGAIFASKKPHMVDTILGSCIAVTLWDPVMRIGGINHYMLPAWNGEGNPSFKYGDIAISELIKRMLAFGSVRNNLKAKIFGGSESGMPNSVFHIGKRNMDLAFAILKKEQIPIVSQSIGGTSGRKVVFYSESGEVMIKNIHDLSERSSTKKGKL
jgi:chemotaxis protein CheD